MKVDFVYVRPGSKARQRSGLDKQNCKKGQSLFWKDSRKSGKTPPVFMNIVCDITKSVK
jgi:hypothetical protein